MSSDDGFDDLSFPEIPPDVWASIHKYETSTPNEPNGLNDLMDSEFDGFNELENALLSPQFHPLPLGKDHDDPTTAQEEEDRLEAELWDEYPELTHEDWAQLHSDILFGSDSDSKRDMEDFASKYRKFISVTEVSALIWCEVKARYDVLGLKQKKVEDRPEKFESVRKVVKDNKTVVKKKVIRVDKQVAEIRDKETKKGVEIHRELENEVSKRVYVRTQTKEEDMALRIMNMIIGLASLKDHGLWREMPVFGKVGSLLVNGIIDEVVLVPSDPSRTKGTYKLVIADTKTKATSQIPQSIHDSHKIQLMLYKRLLDDLLSPKFGWIPYIESRKLEPCLVFSDEFKARMIGLANTEKLADRIAHASCLLDLTFVWKATVDELQLAKIEVDKELSISYRRATQSTGKTRSPERKGEVLGTKQVLYDEDFLQQKIELVSELIYGSRQPRGVSLQDTWRCESCEYKMDCEWREEQAELFTERYSKGPVSSFLVNQ